MKIIEHKEAPISVIIALQTYYKDAPIEKVIFDADIDLLHGKMAIYNPNTQTVIIDLAACCNDTQWTDIGMLILPNAYCNMLYCVFHEGAHAEQWALDPSKFDFSDPEAEQMNAILEAAADKTAKERMERWLDIDDVPTIDKMGWAKHYIKAMLNALYLKYNTLVDTEISCMGTNAQAYASVVAAQDRELRDGPSTMMELIDKGDFGVVINGEKFLSAHEALTFISEV